MKTVLITGAGGFIGKNIREQLKDKYHLLTPSRRELNLLDKKQVDDYFTKKSIDVVVHCALVGGSIKEQEVASALSDNLRMFLNIVSNKGKFKKMIHLGSGAEYDKNRPLINVKETEFGKSIPQDDYSLFKYVSSKIIENYSDIVCLRIFGLFGKYDDYRLRFISNSICRNLLGLSIVIRQNRVFDYVYIDDFVKIIDYFIDHKASHTFYNMGSGSKIDLVTIARLINRASNKKSKIIVKNSGLGHEYTCDNSRLHKQIPNLHFTDAGVAIKKLFEWYTKHRNELGL